MRQLFMRRPDLENLPALFEPPGYVLRRAQRADEPALARLLSRAFEDASWTTERVRAALIEAPDVKETWVIAHNTVPVATASARLLPDQYPGSGYVHWVAADPEHAGKRLGYLASLAVLHAFVRLGCRDAVLETDDARFPAIRTYRNLGFAPELCDPSHAGRWAAVDAGMAQKETR